MFLPLSRFNGDGMNIDCEVKCKYHDDSGGEQCGAPDPAEMCRQACPYVPLSFLPKAERIALLGDMRSLIEANARRKTLKDVQDMLFLEQRKELGMIVGGTEVERAVTKIFAQFIKRVEAME